MKLHTHAFAILVFISVQGQCILAQDNTFAPENEAPLVQLKLP